MSIKRKLYSLVAIFVLSMAFIMASSNYYVGKLSTMMKASLLISVIEADMLTLRKDEKDFLNRKKLKYKKKFENGFSQLHTNLQELDIALIEAKIPFNNQQILTEIFNQYNRQFLDVVSVQQKIGLEKNDGSYGLLRNAAHKLEDNISSTKNITLTNQLLLLRRHEKDFMLRGDLKYVNAFDNRLNDVLKQLLLHEDLADTQTILLFEQYKKAFKQFVSLSQQKGLTDYQGMIGELRSTVKKTEVLLAEEASKLKRAINQARFKAEQFLLMLGIGIAFAISTLVFNIANRISARLQQVTTSMVDISKGDGDLSVVLDTKGDDEIAELGLAFNTFVGKIHYMVNIVSQSALQLVSTTEEMSVVMEQAKMEH